MKRPAQSLRKLGWRSRKELATVVAAVDLTKRWRRKRFTRWQREDGSREGLRKVRHARRPDWAARLAVFLAEKKREPFDIQTNNCCLFACAGILTITGLDVVPKMLRAACARGAVGVARALKQQGGVEAIAVRVTKEQGFPEVPVKLARRGDVALFDLPDPQHNEPCALGVVEGAVVWFAGGVVQPLGACRRAWRIG